MVINQNSNLKSNFLKNIAIFTIAIFTLLTIYNYTLKVKDLDVIIENKTQNGSLFYQLVIIPKNELNFQTPLLLNKIEVKIEEGKEFVELVQIKNNKIKIIPIDHQSSRKILLILGIPERKIRKYFELFISSQNV